MELLLPRVKEPELILPSYVKLDMAFGVGSGSTLFDKSRYRAHGTISGADWATGLHGYCLDFVSTVPDYVEIAATYTQLNFTSEKFSIVARVYIDDLTAIRFLLERGYDNADGYAFFLRNTGRMDVRTNQLAANQTTVSSAGDIVISTWYTVGFSRSGASIKIYKNGVDVTATPAVHVNPLTCARTAKIGIRDDKATFPFDGKIEFLRIFGSVALSTSEHLAWHNALK